MVKLRQLISVAFVAVPLYAHADSGMDYLKKLHIPDELNAYAKAYENVQHSEKPQSIEDLYKSGEQAKEAFLKDNVYSADNVVDHIVWSEDGAREKFEKQMVKLAPGYNVQQGAELFYYDADAKAFLKLAQTHGRPIDVTFFKLYSKSFPSGESWPAYVEQQTDISSCTKYGSKAYLAFYKDWSDFIASYPQGYYADLAKQYLERFDIAGQCSCESKENTIQGLEKLAKIVKDAHVKETIESEIKKRKGSTPKEYQYNAQCGGA